MRTGPSWGHPRNETNHWGCYRSWINTSQLPNQQKPLHSTSSPNTLHAGTPDTARGLSGLPIPLQSTCDPS